MTGVDRLLPRCTFPAAGTDVTCGWSGGPDSTALVVLAQAAGCAVSAVHVDHRLRPESAADAAAVSELADRLKVPLRVVDVDVGDGPNLEARARDARRQALPAGVLLGHTADDQAETVLLHLLRGAGPAGLGAMTGERRPLLELRRSETKALCDELGLVTITDPHNDEKRFRRSRIRSDVLALLADVFDRDPVPVLNRTARQQREVADLLDRLAADLDVSDTRAMQVEHPALVSHAVRRWLRRGTGATYGVDAATVQRVIEIIQHRRRATDIGGGWRVSRHDGRLRLDQAADHDVVPRPQ